MPENPLDPESSLGPGPFVGRVQLLARLRAGVEAAVSGAGSSLVLLGEAGIGKTRTAEELAHYARLRGVAVHWIDPERLGNARARRRTGPSLVLLDGATPASIPRLERVARELSESPAFVVIGCRGEAHLEIAGRERATLLLEPLAPFEVERLLVALAGRGLGPERIREAVRATGGNPRRARAWLHATSDGSASLLDACLPSETETPMSGRASPRCAPGGP